MDNILNHNNLAVQRKRLGQIYSYLEALNQIRNPVKKLIDEQPWTLWLNNLPNHSSIEVRSLAELDEKADEDETSRESYSEAIKADYVLRVKRPKITTAPKPPGEIKDWLYRGWESYEGEVSYREYMNIENDQGETIVERFLDGDNRVRLYNDWLSRRDQWLENERPAREALSVFDQLYDLYAQVEREAELLELVLGDGILNWHRSDSDIRHPVLLQRLQIQLKPEIPEITLYETDHPVELYTALFRILSGVDARTIGRHRNELGNTFIHPLAGEATSNYLKRLVVAISPHGQLLDASEKPSSPEAPFFNRNPVIFLRKRTLGFASALESITSDIGSREDFPSALLDIVGLHGHIEVEDDLPREHDLQTANEDEDILFSKAANKEQLLIAKRLAKYNSVLVQGPPGTGKSHTIANLIGHLLAHGKSILITSYATKALRVLREHVVDELRPLCVSVLDRDADSREQLENSITTIVGKLSENYEEFEKDALALDEQRKGCIDEILEIRRKTLAARQGEYLSISVDGSSISPSEAAKRVAAGKDCNSWIPGPITQGEPLPLSQEELEELYKTNEMLSPLDEQDLQETIPPLSELLTPDEFDKTLTLLRELEEQCTEDNSHLWNRSLDNQDIEELENLEKRIKEDTTLLNDETEWIFEAIESGRKGDINRESWEYTVALAHQLDETYAYFQELIISHSPRLSDVLSLDCQYKVFSEIVDALGPNKKISGFNKAMHKDWRQTLAVVRISGRIPQSTEEIAVLRDYASYLLNKIDLARRWDFFIKNHGGPGIEELGKDFERTCLPLCKNITEALDWYQEVWLPLKEEIQQAGIKWATLYNEAETPISQFAELSLIKTLARERLIDLIEARKREISLNNTKQYLQDLEKRLAIQDSNNSRSRTTNLILSAVKQLDGSKYRKSYEIIARLHDQFALFENRKELLKRLKVFAPKWSEMIRDRDEPHDKAKLPGDPKEAWLWLQLSQELNERSKVSIEELQENERRLSEELQRITAELISRKAWAKQIRRTEHGHRQALVGWLQTVKKIGKGTGKRVPRLREEARRLMNESRSAVPVWIMPLSRVVESFDLSQIRFDVIIIDEASQSDVLALIALYMGKQVIIVGDDKQVSPEAVGQRVEEVQTLIDEHLTGIPNANLYDGQTSIYDLAMQSFGGNITLLEHFRCAPDIINFSNILCYGGDIRPLRDPSKINLRPFVIPYYVKDAFSHKKQNDKEALVVASLLISALQHEEYEDKTFGVISLVGEDQARAIEQILRRCLSPSDFEKRRILCGNPAHFQGDERDVVFISMVDAPEGGPLRKRNDDRFKKRFNVAASRAKDQMWVVYSLDPNVDLKSDDLRLQLIQYVVDPSEAIKNLKIGSSKTESEFERQVYNRLISKSYRVIPQYPVGYYRIDLVVEGNENRLAIECDGDRYHPIEKLQEDMARQAVLERMGWSFLRIRGSEFFRDPDNTIERVIKRLEAYEIYPDAKVEQGCSDINKSELLDSVKRVAASLRDSWENSNDIEPDTVDILDGCINGKVKSSGYSDYQKPENDMAKAPEKEPGAEKRDTTGKRKRIIESTTQQPSLLDETENHDKDQIGSQVNKKEHGEELRPAKKRLQLFTEEDTAVSDKQKASIPNKAENEEQASSLSTWGNDPIYDAIVSCLEESDWICPECGSNRNLYIGIHGPFFECKNTSCKERMSVEYKKTKLAIEGLHLICEQCGSPCSVPRGSYGPFIGCSRYPKCTYKISIKKLRKKMRAEGTTT